MSSRRVAICLALVASGLTTSLVAAAQSEEVAEAPAVAKPKKPAAPVAPQTNKSKAAPVVLPAEEALEAAPEPVQPEPTTAHIPPPVTNEAAPPVAPPLPVRGTPSEPLELRQEEPGLPVSAKVAFAALLLGVVGFFAWKKRGQAGWQSKIYDLKILGRTPLGMRSELLVVDADGQVLLIGLTPSSIQTLADITRTDAAADKVAEPAPAPARREIAISASEMPERRESIGFRDFFAAGRAIESEIPDALSDAPLPRREAAHERTELPLPRRQELDAPPARKSSVRAVNRGHRDEPRTSVEEQVRGLLRAGRRA